MIRKFFIRILNNARKANGKKIVQLLECDKDAVFLDVGCDDASWTLELAKKVGTKSINGIEIVESRRIKAESCGVKVISADLNGKFPYDDNFFDVVHANQVIEHLYDTDNFIEEIHRVLKRGGYAIISTENLSSWHNIGALIFGLQPFSMSNFSKMGNIGNPFSLWRNEKSNNSNIKSWQHNRLFAYFGLKDLFQKYGFVVEKIKTSGYYPLPSFFSLIDPIHGHYIVYKIRKK